VAIWRARCCPSIFIGKLRRFQAEVGAAGPQEGFQGAFRNENRIVLLSATGIGFHVIK